MPLAMSVWYSDCQRRTPMGFIELPTTPWGWLLWWLGMFMVCGLFPPLAILFAVVILIKYAAREFARANQKRQNP